MDYYSTATDRNARMRARAIKARCETADVNKTAVVSMAKVLLQAGRHDYREIAGIIAAKLGLSARHVRRILKNTG